MKRILRQHMEYGLPFAIITKSFLKKEKYEKGRKYWKPVSSFLEMFFQSFLLLGY